MAPKHVQLQVFIQANITVGIKEKLKICQEQPYLVSGCFIKLFYKTTTCPRQSPLSGPKIGQLILV